MGVFQNRVLKKTFWSRTGKTNGVGRRDLHELHSSIKFELGYQTKKDETGGASETCASGYVWIQGFGEKPERKRSLGRHGRRTDNNIQMSLKRIVLGVLFMGRTNFRLL